jgi:hypothetical protein
MGELVETHSEALSHQVAFGVPIVFAGILMHYLVARGLAAYCEISERSETTMASRWSAAPLAQGLLASILPDPGSAHDNRAISKETPLHLRCEPMQHTGTARARWPGGDIDANLP